MDNAKRTVLLVEDDEIDQMAFKWLIEQENLPYDYTAASSISEARVALGSERFDAIVADYLLNDGTAFDILGLAKDTPVIITTEAGDAEIAVKAMKAGACDYLMKDPERTYLKAIPITIENAIKHKRMEKILDQKQKNLEAIFDAVPVGMLLLGKNMMVNRVNDAVRGMVRKEYLEIINRPIGEALRCVHSTDSGKGCGYSPACAGCQLRQIIENAFYSEQTIQEVEIQPTFKVHNKEEVWLSVSAIPVTIDDCMHVVVAIDDITDRKKAEQRLQETMEMKSQFISTVSHELRTPLGCMNEGITIVLDGVAGEINDQQRRFLGIAKRNLDRLTRLINDVLDFQRLESGKTTLNVQENDVTELAREVHQTMVSFANKKGIDFSLELKGDLPKAQFDRDKIIQVLTNLIGNAVKFTPEQGDICFCVECRGEEVIMRVKDTGMGIPKEALSRIFDRFYRVRRPGKEIQGTGLGLSIVNRIVMMHGGRIDVESEVDKGTTFTVFLPLTIKSVPETLSAKMDETLEDTLVSNQALTE